MLQAIFEQFMRDYGSLTYVEAIDRARKVLASFGD